MMSFSKWLSLKESVDFDFNKPIRLDFVSSFTPRGMKSVFTLVEPTSKFDTRTPLRIASSYSHGTISTTTIAAATPQGEIDWIKDDKGEWSYKAQDTVPSNTLVRIKY